MKMLVTGGAGFIGSHLCEKLLDGGHEVTCLDNFNNFYDPNIKRKNISRCLENEGFKLIEGDLIDLPRIKSLFSAGDFETVVHLAAMPGVRQSVQNPYPYEECNIRGTLNILQACKDSGVRKFLFASSSSVYGVGLPSPFKETHNVGRPASPYAASKLAGEAMCHAYHHVHGMDVNVLRYFTVYGPRQRPEMAIHRFTQFGLEEKKAKKFGDGSAVRDFTYIDDAIDLTVKAIGKCSGYEIYNAGSGSTITINELIEIIASSIGKEILVEETESMPGDLPLTMADVSKAKLKLGWRPTVDIREGVGRFVEWIRGRALPSG